VHYIGRLGWMLRFNRGEAWVRVEWVHPELGWRVVLVRVWPLVLTWNLDPFDPE
jgi:hypothetical protein